MAFDSALDDVTLNEVEVLSILKFLCSKSGNFVMPVESKTYTNNISLIFLLLQIYFNTILAVENC
jgi:hypothetical protein